ncbi:MAG TPA: CoA-transferase [Candidatus Acidoferrales bacterium]|nr:CoA-transferase [Candidatus Acidoferrales bacterium]
MTNDIQGKLMTMRDAAKIISDGSSICCPSFGYEKVAFAFIRELIRQRKKNLYLYGSGMNVDADMLIGAGCFRKAEIGHIGFENIGLAPCFRRAVETGKMEVEDYSNFIMTMRFWAGMMRMPFVALKSGLGTDILKTIDKEKAAEIQCPFTNERLMAYRAVNPDFTIIHVQRVDTEGNAHIDGPTYDNVEKAKSAKKLIVTCEEIVTNVMVRQSPEKTMIPGFLVTAIVEVPFGAHPYACYRYYDYDWEHIEQYAEQAKTPNGFQEYLDKYIYGVEDNWEYLKQVGFEKILRLRANTSLGYSTHYRSIL